MWFPLRYLAHAVVVVTQTAAAAATKENVYETKALVDQYMGLHFGRTEDQIPVAHAGSPGLEIFFYSRAISPLNPFVLVTLMVVLLVHALKFPQRCARLLFDVASGSKGKARLGTHLPLSLSLRRFLSLCGFVFLAR